MKRSHWFAGAALAITSTLVVAQDAPESLLPPGFDDPAPAPTPTPAPRPTSAPSPSAPGAPPATSRPVIQDIPTSPSGEVPSLPSDLPTLDELEKLSTDELDELLGLKPRYDIPPAARRSVERVGIIGAGEGGFPAASLARQPASLVRAALAGTKGPMVSRWGHILLRRALASRLAAPAGMDPVDFAALRAGLFNRIGEFAAARALVQDIDTANWNNALTDAAIEAYLGTADIVGACPAIRLQGSRREDGQWRLWQGICNAYAGEEARASSDLNRALSRGIAPRIDVLLAQRYAGAAGRGRRAVNLEWDGVEELTPWRFALANAVGAEIPDNLLADGGPFYERASATAPMLPLPRRAAAADRAAREGILSSAALVDLYSQIQADGEVEGDAALIASRLREAYVGTSPSARMSAIEDVWGSADSPDYARQVLTAYAAARMTPSEDLEDRAAMLIASMLSAGLERDALRWAQVVPQGSQAWALLALAQPRRSGDVPAAGVDGFIDDDGSTERRKSRFLVAGLAGLGRLGEGATGEFSERLGIDLRRQSRWTRAIESAAEAGNPALVSLLAALGMQGDGWDRMTALHLYHIVSALNRVGLSAEARMIAAEAVARG